MDRAASSPQDARNLHSRTHSESHFFPDADFFHVEDVRTFPNQMGSGRRDARVGCETLSSGRSCGGAASPKMRQSASQKGAKANLRRRNMVYSRNPLLACFVGESVLSTRAMPLSMNCDAAVGSQRTFFSLIPVDRSQVNDTTGEPQSPQLSCIGQVKHRHVKAASTAADVVTEDLTRMDINDGVIPHSVPVSRSPPRGQYQKHDIMKLRKGESLWPQKEDSLRHQLESSFKLQRVETFQLRREESFKVQKEQSFKLQKEESYRLLKGLNFKLQAKEQPAVFVPTIDDIPHLDLGGGNGLGLSDEETLSTSGGNAFTMSNKDAKNLVSENASDVPGGNGVNVAGESGLDVAGRTASREPDGNSLDAGENPVGTTEESTSCVAGTALRDVPGGARRSHVDAPGENSLDELFGNSLNVSSATGFFNAQREHIWGVKSRRTPSEDPIDSVASPRMKNSARLTRCSRRVVDDENRMDDDEKTNSPSHRNSIRYLNHLFRHKLGASMVRSVLVCGWSSGEVSPPMSPKSDGSEDSPDGCEIDLSRFAAGEFQPKTPSFKDTRCNHHTTLNKKVPDIRISSQQRPEDRRSHGGDRTWADDQRLRKEDSEGKEGNDKCVHRSSGDVGRYASAGFMLQPVTEAALWKRRCTPRPLRDVAPQI